ncbi:hypothetical protein BJ991_003574 [Microbacterium immunditiarum]|uniref:Uncharacterized protein n=1 Tax=Microbacterium immunditiarum TaxID=337480 RepID=A0A7Y9KLB8_9MICO|nr:hypothetical protein [Microbacterium immunditiarum]
MSKIRGQSPIDPSDAKITIGELAKDWLLDQEAVLKPSSFHPIESVWRNRVQPRWGPFTLGPSGTATSEAG